MGRHEITDFQRKLANGIMRHDSVDDLRILLASGSKVDEPVAHGLKPLHYAVYEQYSEAVRLLLVRGCDVNTTDSGGYSAMHLCAERGYIDIIKVLLEFDAKVCCSDQNPKEMFPAEDMEEPLRLAIKNAHYDCAEFLLQHGANPNARYFLGGEINMIHPEDHAFIELLLRYGADPDSYDRSGLTPLMKACKYRDCMETVKLLVSYGSNVNAQATARQDYRTVLHYAVMGENIPAVKFLIQQDAFVNMDDEYEGPSPLDVAILTGDFEMVQLLVSSGANVNSFSTPIGSPLHVVLSCPMKNQSQLLKFLLEKGADVNKVHRYSNGAMLKSPLVEYLNSNEAYNRRVISLLLQYGARVLFSLPTTDPHGVLRSLQHSIPENGDTDLLELLAYCSECFEIQNIEKSLMLPDEVREFLLPIAINPFPLQHQARLQLRENLGEDYPKFVESLPFPELWKSYLLFEFC